MKRFVQTVIVLLALHIMFPLVTVQAQEVTVDGMKYVIFQGHAVLAECLKEDVGDLVVPEMVSCNGIEYPVTSIGGQVDAENSDLTKSPHPFRYCETITSVTFPKTLKEVGFYAFQGCKNLKRVELTEAVNLLPHAFSYCSSLRKVFIPKDCRMSESAFGYCTLDTVVYAAGSRTTDNWNFCGSTIGTIIIPQTVESLPGDWLYETAKVGNIILFKKTPPDYNVHNYLPSASLENAMKAELYVPHGTVETYRKHADWGLFEQIHELPDTIHFEDPDTVPTQDSTMATVDSMQYVLFRGHAVLAKCLKENVGDLVIPESVFIGGKSYPVTSVGGQIEYDSLYTIFDGHNTGNDPRPFAWCETITSVKFPQSVNYIGQGAFNGCLNLKDVVLPDTVELGLSCFGSCESLKNIVIPKGAIRCTDLIWHGSPFYYCDFDTVEFEAGRESIAGKGWFNGGNVGTIIIPSTVKSLDNDWLLNTLKLGNIIIYAETPPEYTISEIYEVRDDNSQAWQWELLQPAMKANLIVPDEALEAYKRDKDWGLYEKIYPLSNLPTSLSHLQNDQSSQGIHPQGLFDLSGRRLSVASASSARSVLPKGVYIEDGKKRVRK